MSLDGIFQFDDEVEEFIAFTYRAPRKYSVAFDGEGCQVWKIHKETG